MASNTPENDYYWKMIHKQQN